METLSSLWEGLGWMEILSTALDILIVYYGLYRLLLLIKGTRAAQMALGLGMIALMFLGARFIGLATVSFILDNFISYFIILIIVVFQHDIRRALVRMGQNLFSAGRTYEETHVFDEVIRAVEQMAKRRIGALIVFERDGDLREFVSTGQILDARVSKDTLVSLFVPSRDNVLHDGALIIRNLRIQQAGAVLPLSTNSRLDKALGTRHRAAIGLTEETDAVVLVVSEERGEVSLCFGGSIARGLDATTLRKALLGLFFKEKKDKKRVAVEANAAVAAANALAALATRVRKPADPARARTQKLDTPMVPEEIPEREPTEKLPRRLTTGSHPAQQEGGS